jgi:hypothetical protein
VGSKIERYQEALREMEKWEPFLLEESGLPGRRANLELAHAVAEEGDAALFGRLRRFDAEQAPTNSPQEFLAFCGVLGLGRLLAEGEWDLLQTVRRHASDGRWRIREAVAMALQRFGRADMDALLKAMAEWSLGNPLEQRAAAAALCEPGLLGKEAHVEKVFQVLDGIMASVEGTGERRSEGFRALRKGMGYCWSVAVAAMPDAGKVRMERWFASEDRDVRWIMKENLRKKRVARMDARWVEAWRSRL